MQRVYQGLLGSFKAEDEKHQATHIALTIDEHNALTAKISRLERELSEVKFNSEVEGRRCDQKLQEMRKECSEKIQKIKKENDEVCFNLIERTQAAERLNENLKRICRENANAKRGLKPKKKCSGFVITSTAEVFERLKAKNGFTERRAYKSIIETPYDAKLELTDALKVGAWDEGLGAFFDSSWKNTDASNYQDAIKDDRQDNFLYRQNWRTNKNGLWEIECYHTKPLKL